MVDRRRLPDGLQRPGGKLPDHLADPERPIVVQQTTTGIVNATASTSCVLSCSTMQLVCHTGCARQSPSQQRLPGPRLGAERVQARAAIVASIGSSAVSVAALPAAIASSARWKSSQPMTDVRGDVHVRRIAGEPHAGQAVLHDVERLDHHDTLDGPVAHPTRSLRALPRISAGHRQTVMVIHDAPKILL
jgi:hypothetical protein